jgi:hypothetical protein
METHMPTETAVSLDSLVSRLRVSLADDYYCGNIKCAALLERLNLERQEAADEIERLKDHARPNESSSRYLKR